MMRFKKRRNKCMIVTNSCFSGSGFLKRQRSICQKQTYCRFVILVQLVSVLIKFVRLKRLQNPLSFIYVFTANVVLGITSQ